MLHKILVNSNNLSTIINLKPFKEKFYAIKKLKKVKKIYFFNFFLFYKETLKYIF